MDTAQDKTMQIAVATTKYADVILPDGYTYVEAGSVNRQKHLPGCLRDDSGDHISARNNTYCELTVLYWLWKNSDADIRGLCHYRRLFAASDHVLMFPMEMVYKKEFMRQEQKGGTRRGIPKVFPTATRQLERRFLRNQNGLNMTPSGITFKLSSPIPAETQIASWLQDHDIILLMPYDPCTTTVRQDLEKYVYPADIDRLQALIHSHYPAYDRIFRQVLASHNISYCNMFIAGRKVFDDLCAWLFAVVGEYEAITDISGYDAQHRRIFGYVSEVLINVWARHHQLRVKYLNMLGIMDYFGNTPQEKQQMAVYAAVQRAARTLPGEKLYYTYFQHKYPARWRNYLWLKAHVPQ